MSDEMERDDGLNERLLRWRAPAASPALDERVMASFRRMAPGHRRPRWIFWIPATLAVSAMALLLMVRPKPARSLELDSELDTAPSATSYVTRINASGFVPVPDGKIVISKVGDRQ